MVKPQSFQGRRLLVVEDEYLIAADLAEALQDRGATVIGPAGSIQHALELVSSEQQIDAAVLDINLRGEHAYPVAEALRARAVPFVFTTGYDARTIPAAYAGVPRIEKPVNLNELASLFDDD
jgi:CheY-like chemotaxis protein